MNRFLSDSKWKPTRDQLKASYRLSAGRHADELLGENHHSISSISRLFSPQYRLQKLQPIRRKLNKGTR
jgi:hypothetical protein